MALQSTSRRDFLRTTAAGVSLTGARSGAAPPARRPNLLFVLSDQQAFDMLGCHGNDQIRTPRTDQFSHDCVRFTNCISNAPVCTPYRGQLMTGQHPLHNGCISNDWQLIPGTGNHFGEVLRNAGYRVGYVGKWHLYGGYRNKPIPAGPHRHGFDDVFWSNNCHVNYHPGVCFYWNEQGEKITFDVWEPVGQTNQALEFLDTCSDDRPFALFVSWHPPHDHSGLKVHDGYDAPEELLALYDQTKLRLRPTTPDTLRHRSMLQGHMALCTLVDECLGRLLDRLDRRGLTDNTLTMFTSDHGDLLRWVGNQRLVKTRPEEDSAHVPLLLRYPGRLQSRTSDLLVGALDLMPTTLGLLGLPVPGSCQGRDLSGDITAKRDDAVESIPMYMFPGAGWRGLYTKEHIYAFSSREREGINPELTQNRLHLRAHDPHSMQNLFGAPEHKALQEDLHQQTLAWMERFGDRDYDYKTLHDVALASKINTRDPEATGALKGRPIDLLRAAGL